MNKWLATAALTFTLSGLVLSPSIAQSDDQAGPVTGMIGGGCPMMGMMGPRMMGQGMMGGRQVRMGAMIGGRLAYLKDEPKLKRHPAKRGTDMLRPSKAG